MRRFGYIRVSTDKQLTDRQVLSLQDEVDYIYIEDSVSACARRRPVYEKMMARMRKGDMLIVHSFERAFRSVIHALTELERMQKRGLHFKSKTQQFDTSSPEGRLLFTIAIALASWERDILIQRTIEGLQAAKRRGKRLGRPRKLSEADIFDIHEKLNARVYGSHRDAARAMNVSERTIERSLERMTH